jgi:hypothetical protein
VRRRGGWAAPRRGLRPSLARTERQQQPQRRRFSRASRTSRVEQPVTRRGAMCAAPTWQAWRPARAGSRHRARPSPRPSAGARCPGRGSQCRAAARPAIARHPGPRALPPFGRRWACRRTRPSRWAIPRQGLGLDRASRRAIADAWPQQDTVSWPPWKNETGT